MRKIITALLALGLMASVVTPVTAAPPQPLDDVSALDIPAELQAELTATHPRVDARLKAAKGQVDVVIRLKDAPLAIQNGVGFKQLSRAGAARVSTAQQQVYLSKLAQTQSTLASQANALGAVEIARFTKALNGLAMSVPAAQIERLAALPGVVSVRPIINYERGLSETVAYIGAKAVQDSGYDGSGITVAVLDSGIDYTHRNLGGDGTAASYAAAYGASVSDPKTTTRDGLFPTAKVIEGYDFVGEIWPLGPNGFASDDLAPDPDPIDCGPEAIAAPCDGGHGSHVADIIGGKSNDGLHVGVAPGTSLLAVKVCSAVSTSCSGLALLQGVEFFLDPNGDGDLSDAADVANLSLGSSYGQKEDDLSFALGNAVHAGVVVVASAGNSADRPYIVGSPSSQPEVISVAQTTVPSDKLYRIEAMTLTIQQAAWQPWSAPPVLTTGVLTYVTTSTGTRLGCSDAAGTNPFAAGSLTGLVVLMDRGTCAVSLKVSNARAAGAIAAIVANNVAQSPGDPPPIFSYGGGDPSIPGYTVTQADGNLLKTILGQTVTIDPSTAVSIVGTVVASSSRGPSYSYSAIKPEIGAPGASVSAEAGTGAGETAFGGTSGAAPMVAGSAALVLEAHPEYAPRDVKAVLVNTAETTVYINPAVLPGVLAPITRIGGGEVRVDKAVETATAAWAADDNPVLSFSYRALSESTTFRKRVMVRNYSDQVRDYTITPSFRYDNDAASGAVTPNAPATIKVPANGTRSFVLELTLDASKLPTWNLNGGSQGGNGSLLQGVEFDGYVTIEDATDKITLPWHILPHKAASVKASANQVNLSSGNTVELINDSAVRDGRVDVFSLTGTSNRINKGSLPNPGDNFAVIDLKAVGARLVTIGGGALGIQFGMATNGVRAHPLTPGGFEIDVDVNRDGTFDYALINDELSPGSGQCVVVVVDLTTLVGTAYFFCDADLNSGNVIFTAPLAALGLTEESQFRYTVIAYDNYFTGNLTDAIANMTYTPGLPRFFATGVPATGVPAGGSSTLTIEAVPGGEAASPSQTGLLLLYRDAKPGKESEVIRVKP